MRIIQAIFASFLTVAVALPAHAGPVAWTTWTAATDGLKGNAKGVINLTGGKLHLHYVGEVESETALGPGYPSWLPASTFSGGTVGNPPGSGNQISLHGGAGTHTDTITFSQPVTNPIIAIWSLGAPGTPAALDFGKSVSLRLESGGPSAEYGGQSVTVSKNVVSGEEGNGTVQVNGTFTKIRFRTPDYENYYAFTIGVPQ